MRIGMVFSIKISVYYRNNTVAKTCVWPLKVANSKITEKKKRGLGYQDLSSLLLKSISKGT